MAIGRRRGDRRKHLSRGRFRASGLDTFTRLAGIEGATFQAAEAGATVLAATDVRAVDSAVRRGEQEATTLVCAAFLAAGGVPLFAVGGFLLTLPTGGLATRAARTGPALPPQRPHQRHRPHQAPTRVPSAAPRDSCGWWRESGAVNRLLRLGEPGTGRFSVAAAGALG